MTEQTATSSRSQDDDTVVVGSPSTNRTAVTQRDVDIDTMHGEDAFDRTDEYGSIDRA